MTIRSDAALCRMSAQLSATCITSVAAALEAALSSRVAAGYHLTSDETLPVLRLRDLQASLDGVPGLLKDVVRIVEGAGPLPAQYEPIPAVEIPLDRPAAHDAGDDIADVNHDTASRNEVAA